MNDSIWTKLRRGWICKCLRIETNSKWIEKYLEDSDVKVKETAVKALRDLADWRLKEAVKSGNKRELRELIQDPHETV